MDFSQYEQQLLKKLRRFDDLEREFLKFTYETNRPQTAEEIKEFFSKTCGFASEAFNLKNEIQDECRDLSELRIHDDRALRVLDGIRRGSHFYSILFYEDLAKEMNIDASSENDKIPEDMSDFLFQKYDELYMDFNARFDLFGYYLDKTRIGPIISSSKLPTHLLAYFDEMKETFAFGQYRSSVTLCRALLEMALFDRLKRKGAFKGKDPKVTHIDVAREDNLNRYIDMANWTHMLSSSDVDSAHKIRMYANSIIHAKESGSVLKSQEVIEIIFDTIRIIETLYR